MKSGLEDDRWYILIWRGSDGAVSIRVKDIWDGAPRELMEMVKICRGGWL